MHALHITILGITEPSVWIAYPTAVALSRLRWEEG
jgi:hypothetical protein